MASTTLTLWNSMLEAVLFLMHIAHLGIVVLFPPFLGVLLALEHLWYPLLPELLLNPKPGGYIN
jgi:hypothetical protein